MRGSSRFYGMAPKLLQRDFASEKSACDPSSNSPFDLRSRKLRSEIGADGHVWHGLWPGGLQRQRRAPSQPVGNAPGQRRKNTLRAEGPSYHPRRWIGPSALWCVRCTLFLGRCPRLGWHGPLALRNFDFPNRELPTWAPMGLMRYLSPVAHPTERDQPILDEAISSSRSTISLI